MPLGRAAFLKRNTAQDHPPISLVIPSLLLKIVLRLFELLPVLESREVRFVVRLRGLYTSSLNAFLPGIESFA